MSNFKNKKEAEYTHQHISSSTNRKFPATTSPKKYTQPQSTNHLFSNYHPMGHEMSTDHNLIILILTEARSILICYINTF